MVHLDDNEPIFPPWHFDRWSAVDDRVRGGSSQSHLEPVDIEDHGEKPVGARFWGTLDTKTLGGAGFASQRYTFGPTPIHLPRVDYEGIALHLAPDLSLRPTPASSSPDQPHTFTLVLKTEPQTRRPAPPDVPPSPEPASISYEHDFQLSSSSRGPHGGMEARLPFADFKPVYRGRDVPRSDPRYRPLDPAKIYELSLMCRSGFGRQEGQFGVVVLGIEGMKRVGDKGGDGCWSGVRRWVGDWWAGERQVKL